jgi:hypothetical protein
VTFGNSPIKYADPLGDTLQPLTTMGLRDMARQSGFTSTGITFNREVGKAFEHIAVISQGLEPDINKRFFSNERSAITLGKHTYVVPDGVRDITETTFSFSPLGTITTRYPEGSFFEVKAVSGLIRLSYSGYQIQGELDAVRNTSGGKLGRASLTFITTANTLISSDIINYANRNNIQLWQAMALRETDDNTIHFTLPIPLNRPTPNGGITYPIPPLQKIPTMRIGYPISPVFSSPQNSLDDIQEVQ